MTSEPHFGAHIEISIVNPPIFPIIIGFFPSMLNYIDSPENHASKMIIFLGGTMVHCASGVPLSGPDAERVRFRALNSGRKIPSHTHSGIITFGFLIQRTFISELISGPPNLTSDLILTSEPHFGAYVEISTGNHMIVPILREIFSIMSKYIDSRMRMRGYLPSRI